jgi:predicted SnoaL-like aldol condensation-catalyzing enzyme
MFVRRLIAGNLGCRGIMVSVVLLMLVLTVACSQPEAEAKLAEMQAQQAQVEQNKGTAVAFLNMILNDHKVAEAFDLYSVPDYIQHNPMAETGAQAAIDFFTPFFTQFPEAQIDVKRVIAEGDLVAIHNNSKMNVTDRGRAVVDIFRLENGKVVEHWDVVQEVPETSANENTMF